MLKTWRKKHGLTLVEATRFLGLRSFGALWDIENGKAFPNPETVARIEGATSGAVTITEHWAAWRRANTQKFSQLRAEGRAAAKLHRASAKAKEAKSDGRKSSSPRGQREA
jgi:transcriptional regulator with XRE-family HTH domain